MHTELVVQTSSPTMVDPLDALPLEILEAVLHNLQYFEKVYVVTWISIVVDKSCPVDNL
jgi:hypothetical protein